MDFIERERRAVYADYGQDIFNEDLIQQNWWPKHGLIFLIESPIHLFNIALGLAAISRIEPVDIYGQPRSVGFKTKVTTVVTKLEDLRLFFTRYDGQVIPALVDQSNLMASANFRRLYCENPILMRRQYPFLVEG